MSCFIFLSFQWLIHYLLFKSNFVVGSYVLANYSLSHTHTNLHPLSLSFSSPPRPSHFPFSLLPISLLHIEKKKSIPPPLSDFLAKPSHHSTSSPTLLYIHLSLSKTKKEEKFPSLNFLHPPLYLSTFPSLKKLVVKLVIHYNIHHGHSQQNNFACKVKCEKQGPQNF